MKVLIIGAGIIGITSAIQLTESFPNIELIVYSENFSPNTTSDISAGWWKLREVDCLSNDLVKKWGLKTYKRMFKEAFSNDAYKKGVQAVPAYVLNNTEEFEIPFWANDVAQFQILRSTDISTICSTEFRNDLKSGFSYASTTVTLNKYIPYMIEYLKTKGVKFVEKKLDNLREFVNDKQSTEFDYIVNCTGFKAREFCNDNQVYPVRGQVLRVKAPWVKSCVFLNFEHTYILPLSDLVVLGGSKEDGNTNVQANDKDCEQFFNRCCQLIPSLKDAEIIYKQSGIRPMRKGGVRLELEIFKDENKHVKVIHNYGHGSIGVTLSWGCAEEVSNIIKSDLQLKKGAKF